MAGGGNMNGTQTITWKKLRVEILKQKLRGGTNFLLKKSNWWMGQLFWREKKHFQSKGVNKFYNFVRTCKFLYEKWHLAYIHFFKGEDEILFRNMDGTNIFYKKSKGVKFWGFFNWEGGTKCIFEKVECNNDPPP